MNPVFMTALGDRMISPTVVKIHDMPNENTTTSTIAPSTPGTPPPAR